MSRKDRAHRTGRAHNGEKSATVGFGRPPIASRFRKGTSGNPKGRPKNSKNLKTLIRQALTAPISVQEGSQSRRVSKIEGVVLRQLQGALKGNDRSAMAIIKMAIQMGFLEDPEGNSLETELNASDERILAELIARQKKAKQR